MEQPQPSSDAGPAHQAVPATDEERTAASSRRKTIAGLLFVSVALLLVWLLGAVVGFDGTKSTPAGVPDAQAARSTSPEPDLIGKPHDSIRSVLKAQRQALLSGNEVGWLNDVDPDVPGLLLAFRRIYRNLRAMGISAWDAEVTHDDRIPLATTTLDVSVDYCFLLPACQPQAKGQAHPPHTTLGITFGEKSGRVYVEGLNVPPVKRSDVLALPWEVSDLTVLLGNRVIVAAAPGVAGWAAQALPLAEKAAVVADRYSRWTPPPSRYIVYLAGHAEAKMWLRGDLEATREVGVAQQLGSHDIQVVILLPEAATGGRLREVIQHEFGHVATLRGTEPDPATFASDDSFVEGVAEYIAHAGEPVNTSRNASVRRFLKSDRWKGEVILPVYLDADDADVTTAKYGIGYLTVRYLADKYGENLMLALRAGRARSSHTRCRIPVHLWSSVV